MSFDKFKAVTSAYANREGCTVKYRREDDGRFMARFSDGTQIIGNHTAMRVEVRFRRGNHRAIVALAE